MEIHEIIMEAFGTRLRRSYNLPICVRGRRSTFGKFFCDNGFNKGVEIGVRAGDFSLFLCENNPNIEIACVDPWARYGGFSQETQDRYYNETCKKLSSYNVNILRMTSIEALDQFPDKYLDFIVIDGSHTFDDCCMDIILWSRKVRRGGIVSCHDYGNIPAGVGLAVNAYMQAHHIDPWYITREYTNTAFWVNP